MPTNYDQKRRIGAVFNNSTGDIKAFVQVGEWFFWKTVVLDHTAVARSTTAAAERIWVYSPLVTDEAASSTLGNNSTNSANNVLIQLDVMTNTSQQIRLVADTTNGTYSLRTMGWMDSRGRD